MFPPPIKTLICSSRRNCKDICFNITPPTLLPITGTLGGGGSSSTAANMEYIRVYLVIAISVYINIVYKRVINIAKDI